MLCKMQLTSSRIWTRDCDIVVTEFELQPHNYVHFLTNELEESMNPLIPPAMGKIVLLLVFYTDQFGT